MQIYSSLLQLKNQRYGAGGSVVYKALSTLQLPIWELVHAVAFLIQHSFNGLAEQWKMADVLGSLSHIGET